MGKIGLVSKLAFWLLIVLLSVGFTSQTIFAANFTQVFLRLDHLGANTPLSGLLCATPSSAGAGTESHLSITFPDDFTISNTATNWTTGTSNLPSGSTPWPGISATAQSVSNQTVTFGSSDLTANTQYCFTLTAASSATGSTGNKTGTITTKTPGNTTIDSTNYAEQIISNDQVGISGTVPANPTSFQADLASLDNGTQFSQNTTLTYRLTYGSSLSYPTNITVEAEWTQGTIGNSPTPSVDVLDYVIGSATNAYGNTPPVIDTVNRKIDWTLPSFPANTLNQTVTFQLKTNSNYTGASPVTFSVNGRVLGPGAQTPDSTVNQTYQFSQPGVTPTPAPTNTPTPGKSTNNSTTSTPTPSPTSLLSPPPFIIQSIIIRELTATDAKLEITTNQPTTIFLSFGTAFDKLPQTITDKTLITDHEVQLNKLQPNTQYYLQITAKNRNGQKVTSDLFTFQTAVGTSKPLTLDTNSLIVTSLNNIIFSHIRDAQTRSNAFVVPTNIVYNFQFSLENHSSAKSVSAFVRNARVLAAESTDLRGLDIEGLFLTEVSPGVYNGKFESPNTPNYYTIFARISDQYGNITEEKVADIKVTDPISIFDKRTKNPVEHTRVLLSLYNAETKIYQPFSPQTVPIQNPLFSLPDGTLNLALPTGKYRLLVDAIGYNEQTVDFTLGYPNGEDYPTIFLEEAPFSILSTIQYYTNAGSDVFNAFVLYLQGLAISNRFFNVLTGLVIGILVLLSAFGLSSRLHIPLFILPYYLLYHLRLLIDTGHRKTLSGKVLEEGSQNAIAHVYVYIIDAFENRIIAHTSTNQLGEFRCPLPHAERYKIGLYKMGYEPLSFREFSVESVVGNPLILYLQYNAESGLSRVAEKVRWTISNILDVSFEAVLLLSFLVEVFFGYSFGFLKVAPFFAISTLNVFLWLLHLRHLKN